MRLFLHQQRFLNENPDKAILGWEMGTGKTLAAVEWLRSRQDNAIVVTEKRIKQKWKDALGDIKACVLTKEEFKKADIVGRPTAFVFDEAHNASAPLFTKGRSQIAERTYNLIKANPKMPVLLLTATIIRSNPANLHTLLCYIGVYIDWKVWRNEFYDLMRLPYLPRPAYMPKKDWRTLIRPYLRKYAHIALMSDCVDLPPITEEIVTLPSEFFNQKEWSGSSAFVAQHRFEQLGKGKKILEIAEGYRKVVVVAHYREQIFELEKELSKHRQTYVLHGGIDDQEAVIKQAQDDEECFFIIQASIGSGFDLDTFAVMIFASMSYSYVSFVQMKGRIMRIHALKPVKYIYLQAGKCDRGIYKQIQLGKDFDPKYFDYHAA